MEATTKQTVHELESLTFEQWWLLETLTTIHSAKLRTVNDQWILTINDVQQNVVPQEDCLELASSNLISRGENTDRWWPTSAGCALIRPKAPSPFAGLAAELITPDTSHLERIATALEDIAAGVLAIDAKLQRFIADVDGKDPWASDDMAGHHE